MSESVEVAINLGVPLVLLLLGYFFGSAIEKAHYKRIRSRERKVRKFPVCTFRKIPDAWDMEHAELVRGSVVISVDYFKRFLANLRGLVGGRVRSYETLLDRARREALLRMKEVAIENGCDAIMNVRIETSRLAGTGRKGKGIGGIEILAFGTGLKRSA